MGVLLVAADCLARRATTPSERVLAFWLALPCWMLSGCTPIRMTSPPIVGAIRWDAMYDNGEYRKVEEASLGPKQWHYRLPFFATEVSDSVVSLAADSQATMDQEIAYAHDAGLSFWAFDWYGDAPSLNNGLTRYLSSADKQKINFCLLLQGDHVGTIDSWPTNVPFLLRAILEPSYQKVDGNRPLVLVYGVDTWLKTFGSQASAGRALGLLIDGVRAAGLDRPYFVVLSAGDLTAVGTDNVVLDGISSYTVSGDDSGYREFPYSNIAAADERFWRECEGGPDWALPTVVPIVSAGWDNRPRWQTPPPAAWGTVPVGPYYATPTPEELADEVERALDFNVTGGNARSGAPNLVLIYAWNEMAEGGWLVPTLFEGSARVDKVGQRIRRLAASVRR